MLETDREKLEDCRASVLEAVLKRGMAREMPVVPVGAVEAGLSAVPIVDRHALASEVPLVSVPVVSRVKPLVMYLRVTSS